MYDRDMSTPVLSARDLQKGSAEMLILALVEERPRHGYEIAQLIEQRSGGEIRFQIPSLYPPLYRLERRGLVEGRWVEKAGERRRRFYKPDTSGPQGAGGPAARMAVALRRARPRGGVPSCVTGGRTSARSCRRWGAAPIANARSSTRSPSNCRTSTTRPCDGGASPADADARARAEVSDWSALARDLLAAEHPISAPPRRFVSTVVEPAARRGRVGRALLEIPTLARHAIRTLRTQPLFTATTIATFALGIGATTLVYALVDTVLIAPLPYRQPDRLAFVQQVVPEIAERYPIVGVNPRSFLAYQTSCRTTCDALAAMASDAATLTGAGEPQGLVGARVSPNIFEVLGIALARGRPFEEAEATPGRDAVAIITHGFWQGRFGGDANIVGRRISLDGKPIEVIGVLPASFRFPQVRHSDGTQRISNAPEYFRPLAWPPALRSRGANTTTRSSSGFDRTSPWKPRARS